MTRNVGKSGLQASKMFAGDHFGNKNVFLSEVTTDGIEGEFLHS